MLYIFKSVLCLKDTTIPDDQQILAIANLRTHGFAADDFTIAKYKTVRDKAKADGDLLERGSVISADGKSLIVTMIWKSKDAYEEFRAHPDVMEYNARLRDGGWSFKKTEIQ